MLIRRCGQMAIGAFRTDLAVRVRGVQRPRMIHVRAPGLRTSVQDLGRPGGALRYPAVRVLPTRRRCGSATCRSAIHIAAGLR
jgi:hypothetical protein